jgi:hypothetical protein
LIQSPETLHLVSQLRDTQQTGASGIATETEKGTMIAKGTGTLGTRSEIASENVAANVTVNVIIGRGIGATKNMTSMIITTGEPAIETREILESCGIREIYGTRGIAIYEIQRTIEIGIIEILVTLAIETHAMYETRTIEILGT